MNYPYHLEANSRRVQWDFHSICHYHVLALKIVSGILQTLDIC
jgi:hypothetical protein